MTATKRLPQYGVPTLNEGVADAQLLSAALTEALSKASGAEVEWGAAYIYERKNSWSTDELGGHRNAAYGAEDDDIVLQVTVRAANAGAVKTLVDSVERAQRLQRHQELECEQDRLNEAQAALDARRKQLGTL